MAGAVGQDEASFVASLLVTNERDWRTTLEARCIELERRAVQSCLSVVGRTPGDDGGLQDMLREHLGSIGARRAGAAIMENPLIVANDVPESRSESGPDTFFEHEESKSASAPLPNMIASAMRVTIYGPWPGPTSPAKGVAWEATYTLFVSSCCWCIIRLVPNVFIIAAVVMVVEMLVCQAPLLWTGSSRMRGEGWGGPSQLVGFLQEPVTSDTSTLVTRLVKELVFGQIFGCLTFGSIGFLFIKFNWPLPTDVLIAIIIWVLLIPLGTLRWSANTFPGQVACEVLRDRVQRLTRRVENATTASIDYGSLAADIHTLHIDCERIAWVLQPGKVCDLQFIAVTSVAVLILALGPQAPPDHPMSRYVPPELRLVGVAIMLTVCQAP
jgi:hypothetical protein